MNLQTQKIVLMPFAGLSKATGEHSPESGTVSMINYYCCTIETLYLDIEEITIYLGIESLEIGVWWYHARLQGQDCLYDACYASGSFEMADV